MRRIIATIGALLIIGGICLITAGVALSAELPKLMARVNDYAGVLSSAERMALERKLEAIGNTEGRPQVAVLLPADMGGQAIEPYAGDTYRAWKLGQANKDNGVLIVIAPKERQWRIEVGYGLEGVIPDSRAKAIIIDAMDPHLKGGKTGFYAALDATITLVAAEIAREKAPTATAEAPQRMGGFVAFLWLLAGGLGLWAVMLLAMGRSRAKREAEELEESKRIRRQLRAGVEAAQAANPRRHDNNYFGPGVMGGLGGAVAGAALGSRKKKAAEKVAAKRRDDDSYSAPIIAGAILGGSSDYSSSRSDDSGSSSSFNGGGGDSGGGGASGGDSGGGGGDGGGGGGGE